jgi:hypothetical protein
VSSERREGAPVRPSRADRQADRRRRNILAGAAVIVVLAIVAFIVFQGGGDDAPKAGSTDGTPTAPGAEQTMAFQVSGTTAPMMAVIGKGSEPVAMPYPQDLTVVMPGRGETTAPDVAGLPATSMHIALSNMSGTWLAHYAAVTVNGLATAIDREGGLSVTLTTSYPTKSGTVGPGAVTMTGAQTKAFLTGTTDDAGPRWEIVLKALLANPPTFEPAEIAETDDAAAAAAVFSAAEGAEITDIPTDLLTESIAVPAYPELDAMMAGFFGTSVPTPAIVQNGSGAPGVGEGVATQIIPAGFRITLSQNAQTFDVETTDVFANGVGNEDAAKRARQALGVGRVRVSQVPSGIGDITIVVGKDFTVDGD